MQKEKRWREARTPGTGSARDAGCDCEEDMTVIFSFMKLSRKDERFLLELVTLIRMAAYAYAPKMLYSYNRMIQGVGL